MRDFTITETSEIIFEDNKISSKDIELFVQRTAHALLCEKIRNPVGIYLDRSPFQIIAALAALQIKIPYVYLDPSYPKGRNDYILEDCQVELIITEEKYRKTFLGKNVILIDKLEKYSSRREVDQVLNSEIGFILYTSGSTGVPKGVEIYRESLLNFIDGMSEIIDFSLKKIMVSFTVSTFDIFFLESVLSICNGFTVVLANDKEQKNPRLMANLIQRSNADILQFTPSRLLLLYNFDPDLLCLRHVKQLLIGGEKFPLNLLQELQEKTNAQIYNMYGPTETTIWSSVGDLTNSQYINIGRPIKNTSIYILDDRLKELRAGEVGEICISGKGLAKGYVHKEESTEKSFVNLGDRTRIYRTGDKGRCCEDGNIEFLGRIDNQVKIRGHRIELEEIEITMCSFKDIIQAVVICLNENEEKHLVGLYKCKKEIDENEFTNYLQQRLPEYMIPLRIMKVSEFSQTHNGKVDRKMITENYKLNFPVPIIKSELSDNAVVMKVLDVIKKTMNGNGGILPNLYSKLTDLEIDSVTFVSIIVALEKEFNVVFEDEKLVFKAFNTIEDIAVYINHRKLIR
ncbi:hypothetical protein AMQ84_00795 [Paenibacillus riograndensis]|uniref:Carrier domain-containing protein n=1 Tax=Paenibacillus riograndensis TaxID=483937 RepID=A0A132UBS0_9BACL|nr:hypothetical protein AMQ84_00795 [Paenibacillus riograndensis]